MSVDIDKILKENRERVRIQQYEDTYGGDWSDYVPADKAGEIYYNNIGVQNAYTTKNSGNAYLTKKADDSKPKSINIQTSSQDVLQQNEINQKNDLDSDETAASKELGKVEACCGGDIAEDVLGGMNIAINKFVWKSTTKIIYHAIEGPPHGCNV